LCLVCHSKSPHSAVLRFDAIHTQAAAKADARVLNPLTHRTNILKVGCSTKLLYSIRVIFHNRRDREQQFQI
jgi:hypothetical protein